LLLESGLTIAQDRLRLAFCGAPGLARFSAETARLSRDTALLSKAACFAPLSVG